VDRPLCHCLHHLRRSYLEGNRWLVAHGCSHVAENLAPDPAEKRGKKNVSGCTDITWTVQFDTFIRLTLAPTCRPQFVTFAIHPSRLPHCRCLPALPLRCRHRRLSLTHFLRSAPQTRSIAATLPNTMPSGSRGSHGSFSARNQRLKSKKAKTRFAALFSN
jgi:hypothetical protein